MRAQLGDWWRSVEWRDLPARVPTDLRRALPYALVLTLALGIAVVLGAHLSNAQPSQDRPFGWEGPSAFEFAIAMVRKDLVMATTLPALLLGAQALALRDPARDGALRVSGVFAMQAGLLVLAVLLAGLIGVWGTFHTPPEAYAAFASAHILLALAFYAIGFAWSAALARFALPAALLTWAAFVLFYDGLVQTLVLRQIGLPGIEAGALPAWFYVAQGLSPLASYRAVLILWRPRFRDWVEKEVLDRAVLPEWMVPATFSALMLVLWVLLPFLVALLAWRLRARAASRATLLPLRRVPARG